MEKKNKAETTTKIYISIFIIVSIISVGIFYYMHFNNKTLNCSNGRMKQSFDEMLKEATLSQKLEFQLLLKKLREKSKYNTENKILNELCKNEKSKDFNQILYSMKYY